MQACWDDRWLFRGVADKPVYSTIIHEFGHAMDFAGNELAHEVTDQLLREVWQRVAPGVEYLDWLRDQLSKYSFSLIYGKEDTVDPWEVLAEAFADYEINGDNASDTSKALHKLMVDSLNTARGM
jgi:hypothetical protein